MRVRTSKQAIIKLHSSIVQDFDALDRDLNVCTAFSQLIVTELCEHRRSHWVGASVRSPHSHPLAFHFVGIWGMGGINGSPKWNSLNLNAELWVSNPLFWIIACYYNPTKKWEDRLGVRIKGMGNQVDLKKKKKFISILVPGGSDGKKSACNPGDLGSIPGWGRSPGGGYGYPLPYSCLENPMDRGAWWAAVHGVEKSQTRLWLTLSLFHFSLVS